MKPSPEPSSLPHLSLRRGAIIYILYLAALIVPTAILLADAGVSAHDLWANPKQTVGALPAATKLLIFAAYLSMCLTFLPLPTGWLVSAMALRELALAPNVWVTAALVAGVGAAASTMANLADYHIFVALLRHRRIARIRETAFYAKVERWFGRRPFALVTIFNVIPIPVDVVRMAAAAYGYPLAPFALANFLGRLIRYFIIAFVTFELGNRGWIAVIALLGVAVVMGAGKVLAGLLRRLLRHGKS